MTAATTPIRVIGAGPVGLAAALLLSKQGHPVTVYEARDSLTLTDENSYPIGVNLRGQEALRRIDPEMVQKLRDSGEVVAGFRIHAGTRVVANLESGTLIGTTRARLTQLLLDAAQADDRITLITGHRLTAVDMPGRRLTFERTSGDDVVVETQGEPVLCCDGVWSAARRAMAEQEDSFDPEVGEWGVQFRVLFSQPGASAPGLDPSWHHIFTSRGIYTATLSSQVWCVAMTAIQGDDAEDLLLSKEASDANVAALRAHVERHASPAAPLLTEDDYRAFFTREPFGGAVVRCSRVNVDEWLVLLGDAAHSVIPPTGEGVNSGLEDAYLLADHLASGSSTPFADYNADRIPDLAALGEYGWHLRNNIASDDPARAATNVVLRILGTLGAKVGRRDGQVEQRLFGPDSGIAGYREVIGPWIAFRDRWTPRIRPLVQAGQRIARRR